MLETTHRYKSKQSSDIEQYNIADSDIYQFGCELEFYIDTEKYEVIQAVEDIKDEILSFSNVDVLVDLTNLPTDKDKNHCIQIKPDQSLEDNGIEISIPITTQLGVKFYLEKFLPLIEKYGYTNEYTGLHFHISTIDKDGSNFNFYLYMLMCHDMELLSSWQPRIGYSQNVMDILSKKTKSEARKIKNKKGTVWNLEKLEPNHIEIKSIGGENYHKEMKKIFEEFDTYASSFDSVFNNRESEYRKKLIEEHKKLIKSIEEDVYKEFVIAVSEAGLSD